MGWTFAIVLVLMRLLYVEALHGRASIRDGRIVFHGSFGIRFLLGGGILGLSGLIITNPDEEWWVLLIIAAFVVLWCFIWPSTIVIERDFIVQYVWWRRSCRIPWNEVLSVQRSSYGEILVIAKHGKRIQFSRYHVDPHRFQNEVMRRANIRTVSDAGAPPALNL